MRAAASFGMLDDFLWILSALGLWLFVAPLIALASTNAARQRIARLEQQTSWLQHRVFQLDSFVGGLARSPQSVFRAAPRQDAPLDVASHQLELGLHPAPHAPSTHAATFASEPGERGGTDVNPLPPSVSPRAVGEDAPADEVVTNDPAGVEASLGLYGLTRAGAVVFLIGALLFLGHAVEQDWIGPTGRVGLGLGAGALLLGLARVIAAKTRPAYVVVIRGVGLSLLFASMWMAGSVYGLVSPFIAFLGQASVVALGAVMAVRHRAEGILIWSLLCGFATPWISDLSPGVWETSGYLFVLTGVAFGVSAHRAFRVAPWLAFAGTCVTAGLAGADLSVVDQGKMSGRWELLVAGVAFAGQWLLFTRRYAERALGSEAAGYFGIASHATLTLGAVVMLWDMPALLITTLIGTTLLSLWTLRIGERADTASRHSLWWPMAVGVVGLFHALSDARSNEALLVVLAAAWAVAHAMGLSLHPAADGANGSDERRRVVVGPTTAVPVGLWLLLALPVLAPDHPVALTWLSALSVLVVGAIARRSGARWLSSLAVLGTGFVVLGLATLASTDQLGPTGFFVALAGWFTASVAVALEPTLRLPASVRLGAETDVSPAISWALATLLAEVALFAATTDAERLLRSLVLGIGAVIGISCAAALYGYRRDRAETLIRTALGLGVAQLAVAIAFLWSGAVVTVLWAALGATLVTLGTHKRALLWLGGGALLLVGSLLHLVFVDVMASQAMMDQLAQTGGHGGVPSPPVLAHPHVYGLFGVGAALLVSARALRRREVLVGIGKAATVVGLGLWVVLGVTEMEAALLDTSAAVRAVSMTLVLAAFALLTLAHGFIRRDDLHRRLGLVLFGLAASKMGVYDLWTVDPEARIGLLLAMGALLGVGGFLYARFAARILSTLPSRDHAG